MEPNQVKMLGFTKVGKSVKSALQTKCILQAGVLELPQLIILIVRTKPDIIIELLILQNVFCLTYQG